MNDENNKKVIVSFDLSKEELKKIPQPDDTRHEYVCTNDIKLRLFLLCFTIESIFVHFPF